MSLLKYITERLVDESDEEAIWERWRQVKRIGVSHYTDDEIRDLHAQMSLLLSEAQLNFEILDGSKDVKKLHQQLKEAELVELKYNGEKAMNSKITKAHADVDYIQIVNDLETLTMARAEWKARLNATSTAVDALSREISYRIKR